MTPEELRAAIQNENVIRVIYKGGSTPGAVRLIRPMSVYRDKVRAACVDSGEIRDFFLDRLHIAPEGYEPQPTDPPEHKAPAPDTIAAFAAAERHRLENFGWIVMLEGDCLSLHRKFKNGKTIKTPEVEIVYEATSYEFTAWSDDGEAQESYKPRERPWTVRAKEAITKTFKSPEAAQEAFVEHAKALAPATAL